MEIELASVEEAEPEQLAGSVIGEALPGCSFGSDSEQAAVTTIGCGRARPAGATARGAGAGRTSWPAADPAMSNARTGAIRDRHRIVSPPLEALDHLTASATTPRRSRRDDGPLPKRS